MDIQLKKGLIEAYVLYVLLDGPTYGYQLYSKILNDITISESTLYPIFKRLEKDDFVSTFQEEHNGRLRKYYQITDLGINRLNEFKSMFIDMQLIMEKIIKGEKNND